MRRIQDPMQAIPSFFLYGEPPRDVRGHFLHLEPLADRSRPNDWKIRPHAHADLNHIFFILSGAGEMRTDSGIFPLDAPALLIVPARSIHAFRWEPDTGGEVLTIADSYLHDMTSREPEFGDLFCAPARHKLLYDADEMASLSACLRDLAGELAWDAPARRAAIESHLLGLLVRIVRVGRHGPANDEPQPPGRHAEIVARFRQMVEENFRSPLQVADYAHRLAISVSQLRFACLKMARRTPLDILHERAFLEAKQRLLYTNMTVSEIGYHLGFDDPAYFTRFFTRLAGQSPRRFRLERYDET